MVEEENNLTETPILKNVYQRRIKSDSKKKNIDSFVCNDYDDSIDEVDPNIILKEFVKDINKSSTEYTEDNSNDEDNEDRIMRIKRHLLKDEGVQEKNDKSKKQTIGSKRKRRKYKVEDDDDNDGTKRMKKKIDHKEAKVKRKRNQKNNKRKFVDESSSEFEVTTTSSKALFNAMAILNVDRKKCLYEMGFGSMIGMEIHELPGMLDYIKMIKEKCYSIHQDLISVREKLDEGLSRFPDCKKLNMFREKFEETTTGIDNDDTTESGNSDSQRMKNKDHNEDVHHILNEDDKVDDSCLAARFCSVIEGDEVKLSEVEDVKKEKQQIGNEDDRVVDDSDTTIPNSVTEGNEVKFIENDNVLVDDVPNEMIKYSFEVQKNYSLNECDAVIQDENKAIVQDSVERSAEDDVDSQHTIEDIFKQDEQIQSAEDVGCSKLDLDDAKLDVYNGPDLRSPYEYLPVDVKKPVSDVKKIIADTLFAMIGSKLDLIFKSQSGLGLNHLEMETLTPTLMVSAYVIDVWAELLNILEIYKDESLPLRYFFKITVYRKVFIQYLYYVKHPKAKAIEKAKIKRMKISWRTTRNSTDCDVFTMLHMESYIEAGGEWKCGLAKESKKQNEQLNSLRSKFAAKIIVSEFNLLREKFMNLVQAFEQKTKEEWKKTIDDAIVNRDHREEI
nr:hypothetical protein [Tanacetum cinerariifolium]